MDEMASKKLKTSDRYEGTLIPENGMINNLPDDCLLHIFWHLPIQDLFNVEKVCVRWGDLTINVLRHLKKLVINQSKDADINYLDIIPRCGVLLEELELNHFSTTYHGSNRDGATEDAAMELLMELVDHCRNLKKLTISFNGCTEGESLKFCDLFLRNENLKFLKLSNFSGIDIKCRNILFSCLPGNLEKLIIHRFSSDSTTCNSSGRRYPFRIQVILKLQKLKYLELSGFKLGYNDFAALENLQNLKSLSLDYILKSNIMDVTQLRHLEHLEISSYSWINSVWFNALAKNCHDLKSLKFKNCNKFDGEGLSNLSKLSKLETLSIINCGGPRTTANLSSLTKLKEFSYAFHRKQIGNSELFKLIGKAEELKLLDVSEAVVSDGFLDGAYLITKNRPSNVKLELLVSDKIGKQWVEKKIESPLLVVEKGTSYRARNNIPSVYHY